MHEKCEAVIACRADVDNLIAWQKSQNGSIGRLNTKVDQILLCIIGLLSTTVLSLLGTVFLLLRTGGH